MYPNIDGSTSSKLSNGIFRIKLNPHIVHSCLIKNTVYNLIIAALMGEFQKNYVRRKKRPLKCLQGVHHRVLKISGIQYRPASVYVFFSERIGQVGERIAQFVRFMIRGNT